MFRTFDTNNNGTLSIAEFKGMLGQLGVEAPDEEVEACMRALDTGKNGVLEFEEFQSFILDSPYK